jgi:Tol biopolymer transport system component
MVSVLGGAPRMFRDNAVVDSVSRDGLIAFLTNQGRLGDREIWLTRPGGQEPHKLLETDENSRVGMVLWSPDGQRILYKRTGESGQTLVVQDLKGGSGKTVIPSSEMLNNTGGLWLPDGRLIYSVRESGITGDTCNFWVLKLDERTGQATEKPRRLTNFAGVCPDYTSATHDGRRLTFLQSSGHGTGYLADVAAGGTRISNPRHFTLDESDNLLTDWTLDGKTVILLSNRDGHYGIYNQSLNAETPELMAANNGGLFGDARLSPDGRWIIAIFYPGCRERIDVIPTRARSHEWGPPRSDISDTVLGLRPVCQGSINCVCPCGGDRGPKEDDSDLFRPCQGSGPGAGTV